MLMPKTVFYTVFALFSKIKVQKPTKAQKKNNSFLHEGAKNIAPYCPGENTAAWPSRPHFIHVYIQCMYMYTMKFYS